ncbi:MFS transporter [Craurococcus roseus]|uniref:MFS transporter n=2 Tax=Craurococcus roseus TaxID=77585 RepID=A0ABP3QCE3_9PROT
MPRDSEGRRRSRRLLLVAYLAFVGLGLPDAVTGVAWPSIRKTFGVGQDGLGLLLSCAAAGYLASSLAAGGLVRRLGIGRLLAASSALVALALAGYATTGVWPVFLLCAFALGAGGGAIDAALNLFVAVAFGARQLNWLHAFYGVGAALGPLLMTAVLAAGWSWRWGNAAIACVLAALSLAYFATRNVWSVAPGRERGDGDAGGAPVTAGQALRLSAVRLHVAVFFLLTGVEATAGQWGYTVLTEARGVSPAVAGVCVGGFWAMFTVARVAAGAVVVRVGGVRLARASAAGVAAGALLFAFSPAGAPLVGVAGLWLVGLALGPLFPGLMAETPRRLGAGAAAHAVGFQVAAAVAGAAALPALAGALAARGGFGLEAVAAVLVVGAFLFLSMHERIVAAADGGGRRG